MEITAIHNQPASGAAPTPTAAPVEQAEDRRTLIQAVHAVNEARMLGDQNELAFMIDRSTKRSVVRIVDRQTREVVQQIPSEQVLRIAEELQQRG